MKENTFKVLAGSGKGDIIEINPNMFDVKKYSDIFAPYKFTTEDGVDIYVGDVYWIINQSIYSKTCYPDWEKVNADFDFKRFSSHEAAQAYLDEQNKPKFEVGDFVYWSGFNPASGRITKIASGDSFGLSLNFDDKTTYSHDHCHYSNLAKMSSKEKESALIKEAERRGFIKGAKFYGVEGADKDIAIEIGKPSEVRFSDHMGGGLHCGNSWIFLSGKWATIIEQYTASEFFNETAAPRSREPYVRFFRDELGNLMVNCQNVTTLEIVEAKNKFLSNEKP